MMKLIHNLGPKACSMEDCKNTNLGIENQSLHQVSEIFIAI